MTAELAARLGMIARYDLDPNYYNTLLQQIAAVSPAQISALLASRARPEQRGRRAPRRQRAPSTKAFADAGIKDVKIVEPEYK